MLAGDNNIKSQSFIDQNTNKNKGDKTSANKGNKRISLESSPKEKLEKSKFTWVRNNNSIINSSNNHNLGENILNKKKNFLDDIKNNHEEKGLRR